MASGTHNVLPLLQVTCLGNCDMMKQVSAHFSSISRITGHHVDDLRGSLAEVLSPHHFHLFDNMVMRMESIAEAASSKVLLTRADCQLTTCWA